jgi:hypothetical protein
MKADIRRQKTCKAEAWSALDALTDHEWSRALTGKWTGTLSTR